jgi:hypothetical protein
MLLPPRGKYISIKVSLPPSMAYTEAVAYVDPREVYGWEHDETSESLVDIARMDLWEELNVPPAEVVHFPNGLTERLSHVHYVVVDGHHRHNAALRAGKEFPVLPIDVGKEGRDRYAEMALSYHGVGGYDPERNPYVPMERKRPEWNADGRPTTHHLKETTEVQEYWDDLYKVEALRGPAVLDLTLGDLFRDGAYQLSGHRVDGLKLRVGRTTYDHARSSTSTTYDELSFSYTGKREHPTDLDDLLAHLEVRVRGCGKGRVLKGRELQSRSLRELVGLERGSEPNEVELELVAETY